MAFILLCPSGGPHTFISFTCLSASQTEKKIYIKIKEFFELRAGYMCCPPGRELYGPFFRRCSATTPVRLLLQQQQQQTPIYALIRDSFPFFTLQSSVSTTLVLFYIIIQAPPTSFLFWKPPPNLMDYSKSRPIARAPATLSGSAKINLLGGPFILFLSGESSSIRHVSLSTSHSRKYPFIDFKEKLIQMNRTFQDKTSFEWKFSFTSRFFFVVGNIWMKFLHFIVPL